MTLRTQPPFRADHVGSLLRPDAIKAARAKLATGAGPDELRAIEDQEITRIIRRQEDAGLSSITDGEFRRESWYGDFLRHIDGLQFFRPVAATQFKEGESKARGFRAVGKIGFSRHPMVEDFRFLAEHTTKTAKVTIPAPSMVFFNGLAAAVPADVYPDRAEFLHDLGAAYAAAIEAFAGAGCRYLQIDEVNFAMACDPKRRETIKQQGDDPDALMQTYARLINTAVAHKPAGMTIAMHTCRGNRLSSWMTEGAYDFAAERMFNRVDVDAFFVEYDDARSGGFAPLRFVPKGKIVVLGLITSKSGRLESKDELKRRIEQAARYVPLDQLCLSPQCGFASTEEGNLLTEDEQWAKLALTVETAREVWG